MFHPGCLEVEKFVDCRVPDVRDGCEVQYDGVRQFNPSEAQQTTITKVYSRSGWPLVHHLW